MSLPCRPASAIPMPRTVGLQHVKHGLIATDTVAPLGNPQEDPLVAHKAVQDMWASALWTLVCGGVCLQAAYTCLYLLHFYSTTNPSAGYTAVEPAALLQPSTLALDIIWRMPGALQGLQGSVSSAAAATAAPASAAEAGGVDTAEAISSADSSSTLTAAAGASADTASTAVAQQAAVPATSSTDTGGTSSQAEGAAGAGGAAAAPAAAAAGGQALELGPELYAMALLVGYSGDTAAHRALREAAARLANSDRPDIVQVGIRAWPVVGAWL